MIRLITVFLLLLTCSSPALAEWGPWEVPAAKKRVQQNNTDLEPLQQAVGFFQKYISPLDGSRCNMYPTCSGYASQALHKHGPFVGTMMTVDRLYHESDPLERQQPINKWGYIRYYDPLEKNDFWWHVPDGETD